MVASKIPSPDERVPPRHVAIIMDGNGRWAERQGLPRISGHQGGLEPVRESVRAAAALGIDALTLFAFSSENFSRPPEEVSRLMALFLEALDSEIDDLDQNGVRLRFIGDRAVLGEDLCKATRAAEARTAGNSGVELVVAVAYGGRWDIVEAARTLAGQVRRGELEPAQISETALSGALSTRGLPPVDLMIRTGGEQRISNFLLWDLAYSELYFSDKLWPEFDRAEFERAIEFYVSRQRRFGLTPQQVGSG